MEKLNREEVLQLVREAIEEYNDMQVSEDRKVVFDEGTVLYGTGGVLDSVSLVTIIVELEYKLEEAAGITNALTSERAMSQKHSPFRTIASLVDYICSLEA